MAKLPKLSIELKRTLTGLSKIALIFVSISIGFQLITKGTTYWPSKAYEKHVHDRIEPHTVLIYSKAFAQRFGLDPAKAMKFPNAIYAMSLEFVKDYQFLFLPDQPFVAKYNLMSVDPEQSLMINQHLEVFPILFKNEKMPLYLSYNCKLNFYLNSSDPQIKDVRMPAERIWSYDMNDKFVANMILPVAEKRIKIIHDDNPKIAKRTKDLGMHYSLASYFMDNFSTIIPVAVLFKSYRHLWDLREESESSLYTTAVYQNILPNLTVMTTYFTGCSYIQEYGGSHTWLWLEKKSGKEYDFVSGKPFVFSKSDFYQFKIPSELFESSDLKIALQQNQHISKHVFKTFFPSFNFLNS